MPIKTKRRQSDGQDEGYMLLAVVVAVFVVLLFLSIAAPQMAIALKHDQEVETKHRADQYVRAIRLYYRKLHSYPVSLDILSQKTNGQRFLRQKYLDPLTGKSDWRLILVGQNKTKVKGLFGQDLPGLSDGGLGSASGMQSGAGQNGAGNNSGSAFGNSGGSSSFGGPGGSNGSSFGSSSGVGGSSFGGSSFGGSSSGGSSSFGGSSGALGGNGSGTTNQSGTANPAGGSSTGPGATPGSPGSSADDNGIDGKLGTGPIMGVGVPKDGEALLTVNEKTNYKDWEFLYDPRTETNVAAGIGSGGLGTGSGLAPTPGTGNTPGPGGTNTTPFGSTTPNPDPNQPPPPPNPSPPPPQIPPQ